MRNYMKQIKTLLLLVLVITIALPAFSADKVDSKIRFNDFYGEVKIRPNAEEDDSYEFVDLDTVIYEDDRIKTEEDSGAILGLEDMSTYVIKPETVLIIHTEEGNVSKIEMIASVLLVLTEPLLLHKIMVMKVHSVLLRANQQLLLKLMV